MSSNKHPSIHSFTIFFDGVDVLDDEP